MTPAQRDLIESILTLSREGEAPTAYRLATHIGLTYRDSEPSEADIEATLDELVREGHVKAWRVYVISREQYSNAPWITVYVVAERRYLDN